MDKVVIFLKFANSLLQEKKEILLVVVEFKSYFLETKGIGTNIHLKNFMSNIMQKKEKRSSKGNTTEKPLYQILFLHSTI